MSKYIKGRPGYQKHHKMIYGLISLIGFAMVITIFTISYIHYGTARNYFNILSVLIILPTAKFFVQYIMIPWKQVDPERYESLKKEVAPLPLYCELAMTGSEKHFEILYLFISPDNHILAYSENQKNDPALFQKAVTNFLNYYNWDTQIKLYFNEDAFCADVIAIAAEYKDATQEQLEHVEEVFSKISIMSV